MYLLDTNMVIYFFKGIGNVAGNLLTVSPKDVAMPSIVLFELQCGILKLSDPEKRQAQLEDFLQTINHYFPG